MTIYLAIMKNDYFAEPVISIHKKYDKAVDAITKFFKSYGFTVSHNLALDASEAIMDDVTIYKKTRIKRFVHADGDGPSGYIKKSSLKN
jgi:hypothetical protein